MFKKLGVVLLSLSLAVSLAGCGKGQTEVNTKAAASDNGKTGSEENWKPDRDFTIRVPSAAGDTMDTISRIVAQGLQSTYGKNAVISNIPGASGAVAATDLLSADPNPGEMMTAGIAFFSIAPLFNSEIKSNIDDYRFICGLTSENFILCVRADSGIKDLNDLIEYGKNGHLVFGGSAAGGAIHMLATSLFGQAGVDFETVTAESAAGHMLNLASGQVDCAMATVNSCVQFIEEGSVIPILVFDNDPYEDFDGFSVPTAKSYGYDIVYQSCNFLLTRAEVDQKVVDDIYQSILAYAETEDFKKTAETANYIPDLISGEEVKQIVTDSRDFCTDIYNNYYKQ